MENVRRSSINFKALAPRSDYFFPPHGGRPPSDEAIKVATRRYVEAERNSRNATVKSGNAPSRAGENLKC